MKHESLRLARSTDGDGLFVPSSVCIYLIDCVVFGLGQIGLRTGPLVSRKRVCQGTCLRLPDAAFDPDRAGERCTYDGRQLSSQLFIDLRRWRTIPAGSRECIAISDVATGPGDEFLGAANLSCGGLPKGPEQQVARDCGRYHEHEPEDEQPAAERSHEVPGPPKG